VVFTSNRKQNKRIGKAKAVRRELRRCRFTKRKLSNTANRSLLTHGRIPWAMCERILSHKPAAEMGFLWRVHGAKRRYKVLSCEISEALDFERFFLRNDIQRIMFPWRDQTSPRKIGEANHADTSTVGLSNHLKIFKGHLVFTRYGVLLSWVSAEGAKRVYSPCKLGLRTKKY